MNLKPQLRSLFDRTFACLPEFLHRGLLKSYANMPGLTLRSRFRCYPQKFTSPLVDPSEIRIDLDAPRGLPGIPLDHELIFGLIEKLRPFALELDWMDRKPDGRVKWHETYTTLDSAVLYCMIRHLKPRRMIEVGCGCSSAVSSKAIRHNRSEGHGCEVTYIEPYPGPRLEGVDLAGELLVRKIEEMPLDYFQSLGPDDILFIDTSHVIKCQNDVEYELLHILPSLNPGVWIQIHDIYTPYDQPHDWLLGRRFPGHANEQYAVECLLSGGDRFELAIPLYWLGKDHPERMSAFLGGANDRGQTVWLRKSY